MIKITHSGTIASDKKELIRKAAIELISEIGFHNCNTDKIAQKARISVGTIYNYFKNKEDILCYIFKVEHEKTRVFLEELSRTEMNVPEKIEVFLQEYFKRVMENKNLTKLINDESNRPASVLPREVFEYLLYIYSFLQNLLERGIKEGTIREDIDAGTMASVIMGSANSMAVRGYLNLDELEVICKRAPKNLLQIFRSGLFKEK